MTLKSAPSKDCDVVGNALGKAIYTALQTGPDLSIDLQVTITYATSQDDSSISTKPWNWAKNLAQSRENNQFHSPIKWYDLISKPIFNIFSSIL